MIFQIDFIGSIIGSGIATGFSIITWVCIEQLKKYLEKRKETKRFDKLYQAFSINKLESYIALEIGSLINEIGETDILKVLRLTVELTNSGFFLTNERYTINIAYKFNINNLMIQEGQERYDYAKPEINLPVKEGFLSFFRQQCSSKKIKLN